MIGDGDRREIDSAAASFSNRSAISSQTVTADFDTLVSPRLLIPMTLAQALEARQANVALGGFIWKQTRHKSAVHVRSAFGPRQDDATCKLSS